LIDIGYTLHTVMHLFYFMSNTSTRGSKRKLWRDCLSDLTYIYSVRQTTYIFHNNSHRNSVYHISCVYVLWFPL